MKKLILLFSLVVVFVFAACDNSLNLSADWTETTVVYAFLDHDDSISYIKVNKAFLGNENVLVMAKERDSSEYNNISVSLKKYYNNEYVKTFAFEPVEVDHKEDGIFYNPYQTIYAAVTYNELDAFYSYGSNYKYTLEIINNSGDTIGNDIYLVAENMSMRSPSKVVAFMHNSYNTEFEWDTVPNGFFYKMSGEFEILEVLTNGDSVNRVIPWENMISTSYSGKMDGKTMMRGVSGLSFFNLVLSKVPYKDEEKENSVLKRRIGNFNVVFRIAGRDYYDYISSSSSGGLNQDLPNFTNVNNGLGLITSRATHKFSFALSDKATKIVLLTDPKYDHLKFKSF